MIFMHINKLLIKLFFVLNFSFIAIGLYAAENNRQPKIINIGGTCIVNSKITANGNSTINIGTGFDFGLSALLGLGAWCLSGWNKKRENNEHADVAPHLNEPRSNRSFHARPLVYSATVASGLFVLSRIYG